MSAKYYLRRPGTNLVAVLLDGTPLTVDEGAVEEASRYYESRVPLRALGPLEPISTRDYHGRPEGHKKNHLQAEARPAEAAPA